MGKIIKDIAIIDERKRMEVFARYIRTEAASWGSLTLHRHIGGCQACKKTVAEIFNIDRGEIHIIESPCTRVVLGVHPEVREKIGKSCDAGPSFANGESRYFCVCTGLEVPEKICKSGGAKLTLNGTRLNLEARLHQNPICDMREYDSARGCWITVTEFPLNGMGRFMNLQIDFTSFAAIVQTIGWADIDNVMFDLSSR